MESLDQIMGAIIRYSQDKKKGGRVKDPFERTPGWKVLEKAMRKYWINYKRYQSLKKKGRF